MTAITPAPVPVPHAGAECVQNKEVRSGVVAAYLAPGAGCCSCWGSIDMGSSTTAAAVGVLGAAGSRCLALNASLRLFTGAGASAAGAAAGAAAAAGARGASALAASACAGVSAAGFAACCLRCSASFCANAAARAALLMVGAAAGSAPAAAAGLSDAVDGPAAAAALPGTGLGGEPGGVVCWLLC